MVAVVAGGGGGGYYVVVVLHHNVVLHMDLVVVQCPIHFEHPVVVVVVAFLLLQAVCLEHTVFPAALHFPLCFQAFHFQII